MVIILYPPQNKLLMGDTVFSMSKILSFCQQLRFLLYNFTSLCLILFKYSLHFDQQTLHMY